MVDRVQTLSYRLTRTGMGHADGHTPPGPAAACPITRHPAVFRRVPQPAHRCIRITAVAWPADRQCRLRTASRRQHGHPPTSRPQRHNRSSPRHSLEKVAARSTRSRASADERRSGTGRAERRLSHAVPRWADQRGLGRLPAPIPNWPPIHLAPATFISRHSSGRHRTSRPRRPCASLP
jgi:hypothetical protein